MFLDLASYVLVASPVSDIKLWLKNHTFTFLTSSLKVNDGIKHIVTVMYDVLKIHFMSLILIRIFANDFQMQLNTKLCFPTMFQT